ncbi:SlyX protein [Bartonella jaculi]|uniref:Transposase n=1 Tax=Bartonella jaculi TaxID=686226 RepID=A0ABP9N7K4_9HYPH
MADENRLIKLGIKLTYQEKLIDAFFCAVINQSKSLHEISKEFNVLTRQISD